MNDEINTLAVVLFFAFVAGTVGLSFWLGRKAKSSDGYFAAHGMIPWPVNGVAFAGDYLSAASFLGICGMIATVGYDGFLYSIGFLAGWVVALFVIAEPMKRLGRFTFADALDAKYGSRGIKAAAGISTLIVSVFYLIPQMVGAGVLIQPLLGLPHWAGVVIVGAVVITIVVTAGMVSTTWVQFIKGSLLVVFSAVLVAVLLGRGLTVTPAADLGQRVDEVTAKSTPVGRVISLPGGQTETGPLGPIEFLQTIAGSEIELWKNETVTAADGSIGKEYYPVATPGADVLRPGQHPKFAGIRGGDWTDRVDFLSLMLALFCGTASLPHILIRYYTVADASAARKSTVVGIATIGLFYVLTMFLGLGAMTGGAMDLTDSNMAAPLLAKSLSPVLFAIISAIAFTTVLGTVSGLILASSGAVAHDLLIGVLKMPLSEKQTVVVAKIAAVGVGAVAIVLGILFKELNVSYLVGWAFSVAASANLPALLMMLFWRRTTAAGIIASVSVGAITSLGWILMSADTYGQVYGWDPADSIIPFSQPGIVTIPLALLTLVIVSRLTARSA